MYVTGMIKIDEDTIKALVNNDLDSSQKQEIFGEIRRIAELNGYCDNQGNPTEKAN